MSDELIVCMADIRNKLHEAGLLRPDEKIVFTTQSGCFQDSRHSQRRDIGGP